MAITFNHNDKLYVSGSNVGIGTDSPAAILHLKGSTETLYLEGASNYTTAKFRYSGANKGEIVWYQSTNSFYLQNITGGPIIFYQDGNERLRINTGGNVGIGTASPDARLEVNTASTSDVAINANERLKILGNGTMSWGASNDYGQLSWDTGYALYRGQSGKGIKLQVNSSSTVMTLDTSGNVGIGTTSPSSKLHIVTGTPTSAASPSSNVPLLIDSSGNQFIEFRTTAATTGLMQGTLYSDNGKNAFIGYKEYSGAVSGTYGESVHIAVKDYSASDAGSGIYLGATSNPSLGVTTPHMFIKGSGNVGIGTTSPSEKLHVTGKGLFDGNRDVLIDSNLGNVRISAPSSGGWATGLFFDNQGGDDVGGFGAYGTTGLSYWFIGSAYNNPTMVIKDTGLVGIGTTGPTEELHIYRNNSNVDRQLLIDQDGAGDATLSFRLTGITEYAIGIDHSDGDKLKIAQSSGVGTNDRLTIDSSGNVGIGTTSPGAKLDVEGRIISRNDVYISSTYPRIWLNDTNNNSDYSIINNNGHLGFYDDTNAAYRFYIKNDGNVGIGTTNPSYKLHVVGSTYLGGDVTVTGKRTHLTPMLSKDYGNEMIGANLFGTYSASSNITVPERALQTGDTYAFFSDGNDAVFTIEDVVIGSTSSVYTRELIIYMHGSFSGDLEIEVKKTDGTWVTAISQTSTTLGGGNWHRFLPNWSSVAPYPTAWSLKGLRFTFSNYTSGTTVYVGQIGITNTQFEKTMPYYSISNGIGYGNLTVKTANDTNVNQGFIVQRSSNGDQGYINYQGGGFQFRATDGDPIVFGTVSNERVRILSDGNVGIGTTNPTETLELVGTAKFQQAGGGVLYLHREDNTVATSNHLGSIRFGGGIDGTNDYNNSAARITAVASNHSGSYQWSSTDTASELQFMTTEAGGTTLSTRMTITHNGNVGIGTTSPSEKLHVAGNIRVLNWLRLNKGGSSTTSEESGISWSYDNTAQFYFYTDNGNNGDLRLQAYGITGEDDNTPRIIIPRTNKNIYLGVSGGNVGIGTTGPNDSLDVNGVINSSRNIVSNSTYTAYTVRSSRTIDDYGGLNKQYFKLNLVTPGTNTTGEASAHGFADLRFQLANNAGSTSMVDIMTLRPSGNVGIGTTSPIAKLSVLSASTGYSSDSQIKISDGSTSYYGGLSFDDAGSTRLSLRNSYDGTGSIVGFGFGGSADKVQIINGTGLIVNEGNVGIGSTAPAARLNVASTGANAYSSTITKGTNMKGIINALSNNADDMVGIYFGTGTTSEGTHWSGITGSRSQSATDWSTQLNFYTHNEDFANINDATQKMVIKGNGNVGISTTSPSEKLHVAGNIKATGWIGRDSSNYITFDETNNHIDFYAGGNWVARLESDGDLHVKGDVIAFSDIFNP